MRVGTGAFLAQTYRHYHPDNIVSIQQEGTMTKQEQTYICISNSSALAMSDLHRASLVPSSEKNNCQDGRTGFKGYFPLRLSESSGKAAQKKLTHILQKL